MELIHELVDIDGVDGVTLRTEVIRPAVETPVPAELQVTPYGAHLQRDDARRHAADGIAIVTQDVRGRFGSGGTFDMGQSAGGDIARTVAWIRTRPWSDGRVVGRGASFGGFTQLRAALEPDAAGLEAIAPVMAPSPWSGLRFRGDGGAVRLALLAHWLLRQAASDPAADEATARALLGAAFEHYQVLSAYDGYAGVNPDLATAHPTVGALPVLAPAALELVPTWRRLWDEAWVVPDRAGPGSGVADHAASEQSIDIPTLITIGWYDLFVSDALDVFQRSRHPESRLLVVPTGHGFHLLQHELPAEAHRYGLDVDHRWARQHLLGHDSGLPGSRVTYWCFGAEEWRHADQWPPSATRAVTLSLASGAGRWGRLAPSEVDLVAGDVDLWSDPAAPYPTPGGASLGFPPGPVPIDGVGPDERPDVAAFVGPRLTEPFTLTGPVSAEVWVSTEAADTDVAAVLSVVSPGRDGSPDRAVAVVNGLTRARHHLSPGTRLGQPVRIDVELGPIAWRLTPGQRLRLDITTSDFPRYDRNLHTGGPEGAEPLSAARPSTVTIHTGGSTRSCLHLHVMGEEAT